jgi:hypothetical protein
VIVNLTIILCTTLVTISDGKCTRAHAAHVMQQSFRATDRDEATRRCTHRAYQQLEAFNKSSQEPLSVAWSCSVVDPQKPPAKK